MDEGEEDREVTLEEFKQFVAEKPEWLYEKFLDMANRHHLSTEDQEGQVAEAELRNKSMEGELASLQKEMAEVRME